MYTHTTNILTGGTPVQDAEKVLIMLHGRGATASDVLSLAKRLEVGNYAILAPQATNQSWYPYSFMAPQDHNEPALSSALSLLNQMVNDILAKGKSAGQIYFLGFSQGACLCLEFIARNAQKFGGAVAFTGGLIGQTLNTDNYKGDFQQTPILITTGDPDMHVPLTRVEESVSILKTMHADVSLKVYKGRPHTIQLEELELANQLVFK